MFSNGSMFTVCSLVFHPAVRGCSKQLSCLGVRLCYYDSNSRKRPHAVVDAINVQAHRKSNRAVVKPPSSDLIKQLNDILFGSLNSVTARNSLESRLGTLKSMGCSLNDIQEYPEILKLTETEVIRRAQRLKRLGVGSITVKNIKVARFKSDKILARKLELLDAVKEERKSVVDVGEKLCDLLQCTPEEWQAIQTKNPTFSVVRNHVTIQKKVRLLQEYGLTLDLMKRNHNIFRKSLSSLKLQLSEISTLMKVKTFTQMHINYALLDRKKFQEAIKVDKKLQQKHKKLEAIAELLDVEVSEISDIKLACLISVEYARKKIGYLVGIGIEKHDIANHFYFLNNSLAKIQTAVATAQAAGIEKPSLLLLVNILQHKCLPQRQGHSRQLYTIAGLLDIPASIIVSKPSLLSLGLANRLSIKKNLLFLMQKGFSKKDILSCPLVLGHDPEVLVSCYASLPDRLDYEMYLEYKSDNAKVINVLQYFIEQDADFDCKEFTSQADKDLDSNTDVIEMGDSSDILLHDD